MGTRQVWEVVFENFKRQACMAASGVAADGASVLPDWGLL